MMMVPKGIVNFQSGIKDCVNSKTISLKRIDDAVKRILAVNLAMGLVKIKGEEQ